MKNSNKNKLNNLNYQLFKSYKRVSPSKSNLEDIDDYKNERVFEKENIKQKIDDKYFNLTNNLNLLKEIKQDEIFGDISSKSTAYISKRIEPLIDNYSNEKIIDNNENILFSEEEININNINKNEKNNNIINKDKFDISKKTKLLLDKIYNKKIKEKSNNFNSGDINVENKLNENKKKINEKNEIKDVEEKINKNNLLKSLNINILDKPKISNNTIKIINKLKEERKKNFDGIKNKYISNNNNSFSSSLRFKYEELLKSPRELILPKSYKEIFNSFISLDRFISLNKLKYSKYLNTFDNLRKDIENITHHSFTKKILQQILYIVPHFYILKYIEKKSNTTFNINDEINKNFDLLIEIPSNFESIINTDYPEDFNFLSINFFEENDVNFSPLEVPLNIKQSNERNNIFKNILNKLVNKYHNEYLKRENIKLFFDPLIENTWEHNFNPDKECIDIPLFEIPPPKKKGNVFEKVISKNDLKTQLLQNSLNIINIKKENEEQEKKTNIKEEFNNKYVSKKFLEDIKNKEEINYVINQIENINLYKNTKEEICIFYQEVLIQIKTILLTNKKTFSLGDFSEALLNSSIMIKETIIHKYKMIEIL